MYTEIRIHIRKTSIVVLGTRSRGEAVISVASTLGMTTVYFDSLADIESFRDKIDTYIKERKSHDAGPATPGTSAPPKE